MPAQRELGAFLQARRGQMSPEDVGLATFGERRRVRGLRREELAQLAGVSASYYTRLEQGQSLNASPQVLDALAEALRLEDLERDHLHALASGGKRRTGGRRPPPERVNAATTGLLAALGDSPAVVFGRRRDVLAWNAMGHALFAGHLAVDAPERPESRPNLARLVFLDAHTRELYGDSWPAKARTVVGNLRMTVGRHPDDPLLASLIGELSMNSSDFASMWANHNVRVYDVAEYHMSHPLVGAMTVTQQTLGAGHEQHVVVVTAEAGSASHAALTLLAQATAQG